MESETPSPNPAPLQNIVTFIISYLHIGFSFYYTNMFFSQGHFFLTIEQICTDITPVALNEYFISYYTEHNINQQCSV